MSTRKPEKGKTPAKKAPLARPATAAPKGTAGSSKPPAAKSAGAKPASAAKGTPPTKAAAKPAAPAKSAALPKSAAAPKSAPPAKAAKPERPATSSTPAAAPANASAWKTPEPPAAPAVPALGEGDLKQLETILLTERQRLLRELGHLENTVLKRSLRETSGELSGYSFHMADVGTDAMEREKAFHFASSEGRALLDVDDALRRLYSGNYGSCESCGNPIGRERLEVVPHARLCKACKEKEERSQIGRS
ncbi:MAG TPA: TraR/DksA C4-type zinc finger protein [Candidatus Eisenbacteria bacterium]|jgi:RNA polymerase-binding transcription factor DksA|nr:TraR/DksA C4-type zinc finger protein [Candidatus Eisenbacteria bacterium]